MRVAVGVGDVGAREFGGEGVLEVVYLRGVEEGGDVDEEG